jgi:glycogen operon protein
MPHQGFTMRHREIPPELRGTYVGMAHPAAIKHLRGLGVAAVD